MGSSANLSSEYFNKKDKPMTAAFVPDDALPELHEELQSVGLKGDEKRLIRLSSAALTEVKPILPKNIPVAVFLAGPENIPARPSSITPKLIQYIQKQSDISFDLDSSQFLACGRAGVIEAIDLAFKYLSATEAACVLVGGVDTYSNTGLISKLDVENRILANNISDGFALGEAAGFLLLAKTPHKSFLPVSISYPGLAEEEGHLYSEEPYKGEGLAKAVSSAIQYSDNTKIDNVFSSMNGESFFVKELGVSSLRNSESFAEGYQVNHPADCYGDVGAATGAILIGLSAIKLKNKKLENKHLVCCSSDMANRAAVCTTSLL
jgi:3-oxoacyl-[acyl-carrier-protein] synthase-1